MSHIQVPIYWMDWECKLGQEKLADQELRAIHTTRRYFAYIVLTKMQPRSSQFSSTFQISPQKYRLDHLAICLQIKQNQGFGDRVQRCRQFKKWPVVIQPLLIALKIIIKMENHRKIPIHIYKTGEEVNNGDQLPVSFDKRISTDVFCTVITALFAVAMLGIAIACINLPALQKMTYPTDSEGRHCTLDNQHYNYLYFPSPSNPTKRLCLAQCPSGTENKLDCWPTQDISCSINSNPQFQVVIYPSEGSQTSLGLYCLPKDEFLKKKILEGARLEEMFDFVSVYKAIGISLLCGLGLGLAGVAFFSCLPGVTSYTSIVLGGLSCLALAVLLLISNSNLLAVYKVLVIVFCIMLLFVGILLLWGALYRQTDINLSVDYIKEASNCLSEAPSLILISFVFVALLVGLIALCTFQVMAYWSASQMVLEPGSVYEHPHSTFATVMTTLCAIEFLWGLCFLKQAFNFILSGVAVTWHFMGQLSIGVALSRLFTFHWGSVAGGAFLLNFLYPFDLIYDLVKPDPSAPSGIFSSLCCCCARVLDLCRTEAMVMINLVGAPYCNSSRLCQQIVCYSSYTIGSDSANRFVRLGGHALLASLATLFGWIYMINNGKSSVLGLGLCFIVNLFVLTFFVCLLKDIAEALLFCDLMDNYLENRQQIDPGASTPKNNVSKKLFTEGYEVIRTEERER